MLVSIATPVGENLLWLDGVQAFAKNREHYPEKLRRHYPRHHLSHLHGMRGGPRGVKGQGACGE